MRLSLLVIAAALISGVCAVSAAERTELHLFKYGRINTESRKLAFLDFQDLLHENMPKLASELKGNVTLPALDQLMLKLMLDNSGELRRPAGSLGARRQHWQESGALGLLTGYVEESDTIPYVHTRFYLGDLHSAGTSEVIEIEIPITGDTFDTTDDSHSVATLYALAHEIGKDCNNSPAAFYLLSEAEKRAKAVEEDTPQLGSELQTMVENAVTALKAKCHG